MAMVVVWWQRVMDGDEAGDAETRRWVVVVALFWSWVDSRSNLTDASDAKRS